MRQAIAVAVLLSTAGCIGTPAPVAACEGTLEDTVTHIVDGDTLDAQACGRIRLALVDTPERGEPGFANATAFTAARCPVGSRATVDRDAGQPLDATGTRIVAVMVCGGKHLNAELLRNGHAVILTHFCGVSEFAAEPWAARACGQP